MTGVTICFNYSSSIEQSIPWVTSLCLIKRIVRNEVRVSTCVFDLWSRGHVSSVWIQLGCQEADKVSVVSRATGSDQLWASRAVRELRLYLFPAADAVCFNCAVHNLLWLAQVVPAVGKKCLECHLSITMYSISDLEMHLLCYTEESYSSPTATDLAQQKHQFKQPFISTLLA